MEIALSLRAAPCRLVRAPCWKTDSAIKELAAVNPLRQIPTLVLADGSVMTESAAILIHLGLAHARSGLLPADPSAHAQAIRGLVFIAAYCYAALSINDSPARWTTATTKPAEEKVRQSARVQMYRNWTIFADSFSTHPYLSGAAPGTLDLLAAMVSKWAGTRAYLQQHRPAFSVVICRIEAHDTIAPIFRDHWAN